MSNQYIDVERYLAFTVTALEEQVCKFVIGGKMKSLDEILNHDVLRGRLDLEKCASTFFLIACSQGNLSKLKYLCEHPHLGSQIDMYAEDGLALKEAIAHEELMKYLIQQRSLERTPYVDSLLHDKPLLKQVFDLRDLNGELNAHLVANESNKPKAKI